MFVLLPSTAQSGQVKRIDKEARMGETAKTANGSGVRKVAVKTSGLKIAAGGGGLREGRPLIRQSKQAGDGYILINIRPVHAAAAPDQLPALPLFITGVQ